jgi:hypothetical protein
MVGNAIEKQSPGTGLPLFSQGTSQTPLQASGLFGPVHVLSAGTARRGDP